MIFIIIYIVI